VAESKTGNGDLVLHVTDLGDGPVFDRFFAEYDRAFVLPDEKEDQEGFRACLALNHGAQQARLTSLYGPFREICLVAQDGGGAFIGGANLLAMVLPVVPAIVSANLNYLFIDPEQQGRGYLRPLFAAIQRLVPTLFPDVQATSVTIFIEQNDPFAMSEESYARDSLYTGLDQIDRLRIWDRLGASIVDFDYVQPPLSAGQAPDDNLVSAVLGLSGGSMPACVLAAHMRGFFGISVLKGKAIESDATAAAQLAVLDAACARADVVSLLDPTPLLATLTDRASLFSLADPAPTRLREAIRLFDQLSA
jgi:hypothetical protein